MLHKVAVNPLPCHIKPDQKKFKSIYMYNILNYTPGSVALAASDNSVSIYDFQSSCTTPSSRIVGHTKTINDMCLSNDFSDMNCGNVDYPIVFTASSDRTVKAWDFRCPLVQGSDATPPAPAMQFTVANEAQSVSVGCGGYLIAASAGTDISFYDSRKAASIASASQNSNSSMIAKLQECHTDMITKVKFCGGNGRVGNNRMLASAGEDGLVNLIDTSIADSDSNVVSVLNIECPIRDFDFFGDSSEGVYVMSSIETLSCWHYPSAQRLCTYNDIREQFKVDYLVNCFMNDDHLQLCAGTFDGVGKVLNVMPTECEYVTTLRNHPANPNAIATSPLGGPTETPIGHHDIIRSVCLLKSQTSNKYLITGGEDSVMVLWDISTQTQTSHSHVGTSRSNSSPAQNMKGCRSSSGHSHKNSMVYKPY